MRCTLAPGLWVLFATFALPACAPAPCLDGFQRSEDGLCVPEPDSGPGDTGESSPLVSADPLRLLRRMSLDLRGVLPSDAELDAVAADPAALDGLRDAFLVDPLFEARLVDLLAERWLTRVDSFLIGFEEYAALREQPDIEYDFERAIAEEPLRLMARVAVEDRPWTDIVTAETTVADSLLSAIWPLEPVSEEWAETRYTDGRPSAGILATNGLWFRYYSTPTNYNRTRAAAISRLLLCEDYLDRPVSFSSSPPQGDQGGAESSLRTDPYCLGCHSSLDPVSATLFGFYVSNEYNVEELHTYHPEREPMGEWLMGVEPEWFGQPISGLEELGRAVAADPRFERCVAESFAGLLWRRQPTLDDFDRVDALRLAYLDGAGRLRPLLSAITDSPEYRAADAPVESAEQTVRLLTPDLLHSAVAELTGFSWTWEGFEQLRNDTWGYRVLAGGVDGASVSQPQRDPSLTWTAVTRSLAEAAADHAAQSELVDGAPGPFGVDLAARPGDADFDAALERLTRRVIGRAPAVDDLVALEALWTDVYDRHDAVTAWTVVLTALLRHPDFLTY